MDRKNRHFISGIQFLSDSFFILFAWFFTLFIRFYSGIIPVPKGIPPLEMYFKLSLFIIPTWALMLKWMKFYKGQLRFRSFMDILKLLQANIMAFIIFIAVGYFYDEFRYSRYMMGLFFVTGSVSLFIGRLLFYRLVERIKHHLTPRNFIVIGETPFAKQIADTFTQNLFNAKCIGFISDPNLLPELIHKHQISTILIAQEFNQNDLTSQVFNLTSEELVDIKICPNLAHFVHFNTSVEHLAELPVISINETPLHGWNILFKRLFDILLGSLILLCFSPIMLLIAIIMKFTSPGPLFYQQERMGLDGKSFRMFKFRSMKVEAEASSGAVWAQKDDPRKTRFGNILRKTSMDELPQLFNVLMGNMSLVGPRPERPIFVEQFKKSIPGYMLRHKVKAGMTGWAQINGWRGNTSLENRIRFDLYYISHWSIFFDLKILFLTAFKGFVNKNAY